MTTEEIFKQSGYTIPTDKHDECTKRFDYWDMIAFADLVTEKLKEQDSNLALQNVSQSKCKCDNEHVCGICHESKGYKVVNEKLTYVG